ncbi:PIG-L family deacetylase [Rhodococcus sp. WS4]|nr:PIG-L family deacetylase [Rhodococcus sp. WS4]
MITLDVAGLSKVAVLGAHFADIAIGVGGTLLAITSARPGIQVRACVLSGADSRRELEERHALAALCPGADLELTMLDVPDGHAYAYWDPVKTAVEAFRRNYSPDAVFVPQRADQDHRLLGDMAPTIFGDHLILGYEIPKTPADSIRTVVYHPLTRAVAEEKARLLLKHYESQTADDWFDEDTFLSLSRLQGVHCRRPHAEAFELERATLRFRIDRHD